MAEQEGLFVRNHFSASAVCLICTTPLADHRPASQPDCPTQPSVAAAITEPQSIVQGGGKATSPHKYHFPRIVLHKKKSLRVPPNMSGPNSTEFQTGNITQMEERELRETISRNDSHKSQGKFMEQVLDWVKQERQRQRDRASKREARKAEKKGQNVSQHLTDLQEQIEKPTEVEEIPIPRGVDPGYKSLVDSVVTGSPESTTSEVGANAESLNRLEMIANAGLAASTSPRVDVPTTNPPKGVLSRRTSRKALHPHSRTVSYGSDTDYTAEGDVLVPECEVTLGAPEKIGWDTFKEEVLKLTHTLRCKGWRRVALERYKELEVKRISGALTNAVYTVFPPQVEEANKTSSIISLASRKRPV